MPAVQASGGALGTGEGQCPLGALEDGKIEEGRRLHPWGDAQF